MGPPARTCAKRHAASAMRMPIGHVVEPRRGRVVLHSGGGENYHAAMRVLRGQRSSFTAFFRCKCDA